MSQPMQGQGYPGPGPMMGQPPPGAPPQMQGPPGPGGGAPPSWFKRNIALIVVAAFFVVEIFCSWVMGAFEIDSKDVLRFFRATSMAAGTSAMALLLLVAFHRAVGKDKEHPAGVGVALLAIALVLAIGIYGAGLALAKMF
jgi:hypothetical protein